MRETRVTAPDTPPVSLAHRDSNLALAAGIVGLVCVLLGCLAGGIAFAFHGLGYFAALPCWAIAPLSGGLGLYLRFRRPTRPVPPGRPRGLSSAGLFSSAAALIIGGALAAVLLVLLGFGVLVAVGMLLSHPY